MWSGQDKVWTHFRNDILAADVNDAQLLMSYLRHVLSNRLYTAYLDVIDLQRYKVYRRPQKVMVALNTRMDLPFIFVTGKN